MIEPPVVADLQARVARRRALIRELLEALGVLTALAVLLLLVLTFQSASESQRQGEDIRKLQIQNGRLLDELAAERTASDAATEKVLAALRREFSGHDRAVRDELREILANARVIVERTSSGELVVRIVRVPAPPPSCTPRGRDRCR